MKIFFTLGLGAVILLSSCNTSQDVASNKLIQKRKYTKGFHLNLNLANKEKQNSTADPFVNEAAAEKKIKDNRPQTTVEVYKDESFMASTNAVNNFAERSAKTVVPEVQVKEENTELAEPNLMSVAEARAFKKEFKKQARDNFREYSSSTAQTASAESLLLYVILAIILPPLAVGLLYGIGAEFWLSLILTIIFWIPGVIYALIKVFQA